MFTFDEKYLMLLFFLSFQTSQYSKLEKADILEMTVKHLKNVQHQQLVMAAAADNTVVGKYRAGFSECAQEVTRYLSQVEGLHPETRGKLEMHLQNCLQRTAQMTETHQPQPQNHGSPANQQLHVGIPAATQMTSLSWSWSSAGDATVSNHQHPGRSAVLWNHSDGSRKRRWF